MKAFLVAGTNSGAGKTTISMALMKAFMKKGNVVQPFKTGPDYIDPKFHEIICGRPSRNLDAFLLTYDAIKEIFVKGSVDADISIVEGVMGLYDGRSMNTTECSSYEMAKHLNLPIILVVNGKGMALSLVALVKGFIDFGHLDPKKVGILLNNASKGTFDFVGNALTEHLGVQLIGYVPHFSDIQVSERKLGLRILDGEESKAFDQQMDKLAEKMEDTIDFQALEKLADIGSREAYVESLGLHGEDVVDPSVPRSLDEKSKVRIAMAYDEAFNFYYRDNLDLLESKGAELIRFSPLRDTLPEGIGGIYIGGGYPELYTKELSANKKMRSAIKKAAEDGMPIYAECGGMMYLGASIEDEDGPQDMVGVFEYSSRMTSSLQRFGYVEIHVNKDNSLTSHGDQIRAHEFHYSELVDLEKVPDDEKKVYTVKKKRRSKDICWDGGFVKKRCFGAYAHIHFYNNIKMADRFIGLAKEFSNENQHQ